MHAAVGHSKKSSFPFPGKAMIKVSARNPARREALPKTPFFLTFLWKKKIPKGMKNGLGDLRRMTAAS